MLQQGPFVHEGGLVTLRSGNLPGQLARGILAAFADDVEDVLFLESDPKAGRPSPKMFVIVKRVDLDLYEELARVTMQIGDALPGQTLNFDFVSAEVRAMLPFEAVSLKSLSA